ncbi:MAG: hypothetical protein KME21_28200 [Desmonostoc vinosum HA7617-LM4]|jgi:ubiquinone biosynthesis protein Coq4|nr:hypothetical protein [Desmonostoc vinosum HA7617-LM4]
MLSASTAKLGFQQHLQKFNPLAGINWLELSRAYRVFLSNPSQGILHIIEAARHSNWQQWVEQRLASQATHLCSASIQIDIQQLSKLPSDTLGGAYARHIISSGFNPEAFVTLKDGESSISRRLAISHDVHHVIIGFEGTPIGEFGLAVFVLLQYRDLLNVFVLSHAPWFAIGHIHQVPKLIAALSRGLQTGLKCKPIIAYPFEQNWHKPIKQVRQELGILAVLS